MKLKVLINKLNKIHKEHGNILVCLNPPQFYSYTTAKSYCKLWKLKASEIKAGKHYYSSNNNHETILSIERKSYEKSVFGR